jgi:hypothetical protein
VESFAILWSLVLAEFKKITWIETKEFLKRRFPPLTWIPIYTLEKFQLDLTVAALVFSFLPRARN